MARTVLEVVVAGDSKSLERSMARSSKSVDQFGKDADKSLKKTQGGFKGVGSAAKMAGGLLAGVAVVGFKKFSDAATDVSESLSKNRVLFGQHAKTIEAFSKTSAKSFGISQRAALEYTGVFGNLARATGISQKQSAKMSVSLTKLAADMASFNNTSVEDALEALRSGLVGESEPLRKFGVTLSANAIAAEAMRSGLVKVTKNTLEYRTATIAVEKAQAAQTEAIKKHGKESLQAREAGIKLEKTQKDLVKTAQGGKVELTAQQKAMASVALITRQTALAQGDFAKTSDGLANKQRILNAQLEDASVALGQKLVPAALAGVGALTGLIGVMGQIPQSTAAMGALGAAVGGLTAHFGRLAVLAIGAKFATMATSMRAAGGAMAALNVAVRANPIGLLATVVGVVAGALFGMSAANRDAKTSADDLTGAIDRQREATQRLADLDVEAAQRKANVKSANASLAQAERELAAARKAGDPTRLKSAEAAYEQAKVGVTRATREYKRTEEDANKVRRDAKRATDDAAKAATGRLSTLRAERDKTRDLKNAIKDQMDAGRKAGASRAQLQPLQREYTRLAEKEAKQTANIRREMDHIPKAVRASVKVKFSLEGVSGFLNDVGDAGSKALDGKGDGLGVAFRGAVSNVVGRAQDTFKANVPKVPSVGGGSGLNAFNGVAGKFPGLRVGSGFRPGSITSSGNLSYHAMGMARDFPGPPASMLRFFKYMKSRYGSRLAELIYTPGGTGIKDGRPFRYGGKVAADHFDHVHVAMRPGGSRQSGQGDGYGVAGLKSLAMAQGLSESRASIAAAVGMAESGGNPRAMGRNANGTVDRGLWQINSIHRDSTFSVGGNAKAMARISRGGSDFQPWAAYSGPDFKGSDGPWRRFYSAARKAKANGRKGGLNANQKANERARQQAESYKIARNPSSSMGGSSVVGELPGARPLTDAQQVTVAMQEAASEAGSGGSAAGPTGDAQLDPLNAQLALAGLTKDTTDDLAALGGIEGVLSGRLADAQAKGDFSAIIDLANALKGTRDQIESLATVMDEVKLEMERARADNERQLKEQAMQRERLSQTQYGVIANALSEMVNGNLGGRIGLGYQSVGFAGSGARY